MLSWDNIISITPKFSDYTFKLQKLEVDIHPMSQMNEIMSSPFWLGARLLPDRRSNPTALTENIISPRDISSAATAKAPVSCRYFKKKILQDSSQMQLLLTSCIHLNQYSQSKNHWQSPHSLSHIFMVSNNLIPLWLLQLPCSLITCTGTLDLHSLHPLLTLQDSFCESVLSQSSGNCSLPSRPCLILSWHHHEITSIHMMCYPIFLLFLKYLFTTSNKFIKKNM